MKFQEYRNKRGSGTENGIVGIEEMKVENMKANDKITTMDKELFRRANFSITVHRGLIEYGYDRKPGKMECFIGVAGIKFVLSEDSALSIISEMQRLGISEEGVRVEYGD